MVHDLNIAHCDLNAHVHSNHLEWLDPVYVGYHGEMGTGASICHVTKEITLWQCRE